jgi:hypothetical protein
MVNLREIDRQFRPSDRQPNLFASEGRRGIEQLVRDAGSALHNTRQKYNRYSQAKKDLYNNRQIPLDHNQDALRFIGNLGATGGEWMHDAAQLIPEGLGQIAGLDVGSGKGWGDIPYFFGQKVSPRRDENRRVTTDALDEIRDTIPAFGSWEIGDDPGFQDYLQNVKGYNISDDFGVEEFHDAIIMPNIQSFEDFETASLFDKGDYASTDDYYNAIYDQYQQHITPDRTRLYNEIVDPYYDQYVDSSTSNLAEQLGISEQLANSMLTGTGDDYDLGLLNDLFGDSYKPFEYQTEEGKEFFEDPVMEIGGSIPAFGVAQNVFSKGLKYNKFINNILGQAYPVSAGLRLNAYPAIPNALKQFSNKFGGTHYKPTYTKRPYGMNPVVRSGAQTYGIMELADQAGYGVDEYGRRTRKD